MENAQPDLDGGAPGADGVLVLFQLRTAVDRRDRGHFGGPPGRGEGSQQDDQKPDHSPGGQPADAELEKRYLGKTIPADGVQQKAGAPGDELPRNQPKGNAFHTLTKPPERR